MWSESPQPGPPFADRSTAAHTVPEALGSAAAGDTVLVHPRPDNQPYEQVALNVSVSQITLRSMAPAGSHVPLSGRGFDHSGRGNTPRAIIQFNPGADDCILEGFELFGAHNESHNGSGIRINQANGITVRRCVIRHNDMGIMSGGDGTPHAAVDQLIEGCLIHSNGDLTHPGYNHNLYLGGTSVTLLGCEVHSSLTGHNVKSRAHRTAVLACYVHDAANREFDLVDARGDTDMPESHAVLAGNVIVKAADCAGNRGVIHFGQDGGHEHDGTLFLAHNTIVTPFISPVVDLSASRTRAALWNNLVSDGGVRQHGQRLVSGRGEGEGGRVTGCSNWLAEGFAGTDFGALGLSQTRVAAGKVSMPWVDQAAGDHRLGSPVVGITDAGCPLPVAVTLGLGRPLPEYVAPLGWRDRPDDGKPDLGAFEHVAGIAGNP